MNPIYEQLQLEEEKKYLEAIHKFSDAVEAFRKLTSEQKQRFFKDVCVNEFFREAVNK